MDLGPAEIAIVLLIVVMVFGSARLKDLGSSLGQGIKEFRSALKEDDEDAPATVTASSLSPTEAPDAEAVSACAGCGHLTPLDARFCSECGASTIAPAI